MTTITLEEDIFAELEMIARRKLTTVETLVKETLQRYLQSTDAQPPRKYSFIGIGRSGQKNISTQVEETLAKGANRIEGWSLS